MQGHDGTKGHPTIGKQPSPLIELQHKRVATSDTPSTKTQRPVPRFEPWSGSSVGHKPLSLPFSLGLAGAGDGAHTLPSMRLGPVETGDTTALLPFPLSDAPLSPPSPSPTSPHPTRRRRTPQRAHSTPVCRPYASFTTFHFPKVGLATQPRGGTRAICSSHHLSLLEVRFGHGRNANQQTLSPTFTS